MVSRKSAIVLTATVVLLGSVISIVRQCSPTEAPAMPTEEWYYDLNSGKLFVVPQGSHPPAAAPSGPLPDGSPAGVRAYVYGCGGCSDEKRYIGYVESHSSQDRQGMDFQQRQLTQVTPDGRAPVLQPDPNVMAGSSALIKRPNDKEWVGKASKEGLAIVSEALSRCATGVYPRICQPGSK